MKNIKFVTCIIVAVLYGCTAQEREPDDDVKVSQKCAAVLLASTTTLGVGLATLTPTALCSAGFCATGVAGGSFASWWQSTIPLVVKGSLFAQLQAMAMGGIGVSSSVAAGAVGGLIGATYLKDFCTFVDETDPESITGQAFQASVTAVTTAIKTKETVQSHCDSSTTCTATVNKVSSMWDSFTTGVSTFASGVSLRYDISKHEREIDELKGEFGILIYDYIRKSKVTWANAELDNICNYIFEKIQVFEEEIVDYKSKGLSTRSPERRIEYLKTKKFGTHVFDYMRHVGGWTDKKLEYMTNYMDDLTYKEIEHIYNVSLEKISALDLLIQNLKDKLVALA